MAYAVEKWDRLVSDTLHPEHLPDFVTHPETLQVLLNDSEAYGAKVRRQLIRQAFTFSKEKAMELFVQQHQAVLIRLLDKVHAYRKMPDVNRGVCSLYEGVENHLQDLLNFIEHYFTKYFNLDERVPLVYLNLSKKDLCAQLPACRAALAQRPDADEQLVTLICDYMAAFCTDGYLAYTYRDLIYYKELLVQISTLGTNGKVGHLYTALKEVLIYLNFNALPFIDYFIASIHKELGDLQDNAAKMERLALHHKKIGQMQLKPGFSLHSEFPTVRETLLEVIEREMEYLATIKSQVLASPPQSLIALPEQPEFKVYVTVPFKVPEIYLLNKAFIDAGGAPTETYKSLLEKVGPRLANKNHRGFSPESLQKASDKVDPEAKENIKRFLQRMIRNIDSYD